jgi:hypothetical protein
MFICIPRGFQGFLAAVKDVKLLSWKLLRAPADKIAGRQAHPRLKVNQSSSLHLMK